MYCFSHGNVEGERRKGFVNVSSKIQEEIEKIGQDPPKDLVPSQLQPSAPVCKTVTRLKNFTYGLGTC
ncbi:unnamed protein product [Linum trigynum]|uniref:Uncharacterized protein n=1 Tax=Linum trigynum TaxID=586398 RepID=A0AAV2EEE2_9ROSI